MGICTDRIAGFVAGTRFSDLPPEVVHQARLLVLDVIGCAFSGFGHDRGVISRRVMESFGGAPEATVLGCADKTSCLSAAYANSNMASSLDNEETFMNAFHFSSNTVFAALALGEREKVSGKDLATAVAVGYEVGARIGLSTGYLGKIVDGKVVRYRIAGAPSWQSMGSVASAGSVLGLSAEQVGHALGCQGHFAPMPSLHHWPGTGSLPLIKYWDNGWMAVGGIMAGLLAREGYTSYAGILDGDGGFWQMYGAESCDFNLIKDGLGTKWWLMETSFKPWPCCRYIHHPLTALSRIIDRHNIGAGEVEKVAVKGSLMWQAMFPEQSPEGPVNQEFSCPHSVAMLLLRVPPGPDWHRPDMLDNPRVDALRRKVTIELDPSMLTTVVGRQISQSPRVIREIPTTVEVVARGQTFTETVKYARGDPWDDAFKMNDDELREKFRNNAAALRPASASWRSRIEEIADLCFNLERLEQVGELTKLCRPPGARRR